MVTHPTSYVKSNISHLTPKAYSLEALLLASNQKHYITSSFLTQHIFCFYECIDKYAALSLTIIVILYGITIKSPSDVKRYVETCISIEQYDACPQSLSLLRWLNVNEACGNSMISRYSYIIYSAHWKFYCIKPEKQAVVPYRMLQLDFIQLVHT